MEADLTLLMMISRTIGSSADIFDYDGAIPVYAQEAKMCICEHVRKVSRLRGHSSDQVSLREKQRIGKFSALWRC